jgi:hypothetical protein
LQNSNRKFWEELISYFPFTEVLVLHMASRKETLIYITNKSIKQYNLGVCSVADADGTDLGVTPL